MNWVLVYVIWWLRVQLMIKYEWGISICNRMRVQLIRVLAINKMI